MNFWLTVLTGISDPKLVFGIHSLHAVRDELSVVCDKSHFHGSLLGQGRAGCKLCTRQGWLQLSCEVCRRP